MAKISLSYNGHDIVVKNGIWERIYYDRRRVRSGFSMFGKHYTFSMQEDKETANYSARISSGFTGAKVTVMRNGLVIYSDNPKNPVQTLPALGGGSVVVKMPPQKKGQAGTIGSGVILIGLALFASQTVPPKEKHEEALREEIRAYINRPDHDWLMAQLGLASEQAFHKALAESGTSYIDLLGLQYEKSMFWSTVENPKSATPKTAVFSWGIFNNAHVNDGMLDALQQ